MGAGVFHGRVRDWNECINPAMATGPPGRILGCGEWDDRVLCVLRGLALCAVDGCPSMRWCEDMEFYRVIRTARLRRLPDFHLRPIDVLVLHGP